MAKRLNLDFGDLETWINNVSSGIAEKTAEDVVRQLKIRGPYWTGEFEGAWDVTLGEDIPASEQRRDTRSLDEILAAGPAPRQITPLKAGVDFPSAPKTSEVTYTIGNRMAYRDIAQDLEAGRIKGGGRETADQDWYTTYIQGGGLETTIALSADRVSKDPKIKNYKGKISK